jgi:hypothetical protein
LLWLLLASQMGYCGMLLAVRPHIDLLRSMATIGCALLQAGTVACTCLLLVSACWAQQLPWRADTASAAWLQASSLHAAAC